MPARYESKKSVGDKPPMTDVKQLVLASNSAGKVREFTALFAPLGIAIIPQGDLGIAAAEEPYFTFVENALTKARHASKESNLPALADDSGICIAALNGRPGVRSARYAEKRQMMPTTMQKSLLSCAALRIAAPIMFALWCLFGMHSIPNP
jgi:XTP/dITP diphosphohydrolase